MMDPAQLSEEIREAEEQRRAEETARRRLTSRVGRTIVPKMEGMERILRTYDPNNETPRRILEEVGDGLRKLMPDRGQVGLVILPEHVFINGLRIKLDTGQHRVCSSFGSRLLDVGMAGLTVGHTFTYRSMLRFFELLRDSADIREPGEAREFIAHGLVQSQVTDLSLIRREEILDDPDEESTRARNRRLAINAYVRGMAALGQARAMADLDVGRRRRQRTAIRRLVALGETDPDTVLSLSGIRDIGLGAPNHAMNSALLAIGIGMRIGLSRRDLVRLGLAALNHNVGEQLLPEELLEVPRELSDLERAELETHPLAGAHYLLKNYGMSQPILERALVSAEHHEWINGQGGYPLLLRPQLHLFSRVVAVCDTFDALTFDRPHRPAFQPSEAIKLVIRASGRRLDPVIVRLLVDQVGRHPPGSLVELDTGEWAIVLGPGEGKYPTGRPKVLIFRDPLGDPLDPPIEIDTHARHPRRKAYERTVVRAHNPRHHGIAIPHLLCGERITARLPGPAPLPLDDGGEGEDGDDESDRDTLES